MSGPRNSWVNGQRWRAVHDEATSLGLRATFLGPFGPNRQGGREAADAFVLSRAGAAIAYNDLMALGALRYLQASGVRLPEDRSLVGSDDIFGADLTVPALTTIGGPSDRLGRRAVDSVHESLTGQLTDLPSPTFETHLVVRDSTGPARPEATPGN
ncbi:substrate-binding domain-containing protein [Saccharomonospora azurea]|uniref:substrate-binding domain-containing protein n=1 Tax=Saccharomonospora azurea TaxID=40988 RepID=UPI00240985E6|nr:substrate-binding domain-containing protein [Saccharomonospora azurea]